MSDFMILGLIFQDLGWRVYKVRAGAAAGVSDEQEQTAAIFRSLTHSLSRTRRGRQRLLGSLILNLEVDVGFIRTRMNASFPKTLTDNHIRDMQIG